MVDWWIGGLVVLDSELSGGGGAPYQTMTPKGVRYPFKTNGGWVRVGLGRMVAVVVLFLLFAGSKVVAGFVVPSQRPTRGLHFCATTES